ADVIDLYKRQKIRTAGRRLAHKIARMASIGTTQSTAAQGLAFRKIHPTAFSREHAAAGPSCAFTFRNSAAVGRGQGSSVDRSMRFLERRDRLSQGRLWGRRNHGDPQPSDLPNGAALD